MWLVFSILSGVLYTISGLITRKILKGQGDSWAFSFWFSFIGAITCLAPMIYSPKISSNIYLWLILFGVAVLILLQNFLAFRSSNHLEPSINGSITKFRLVWVLILGILILNETFTPLKIVGTILTVLSGLLVVFKTVKNVKFNGVLFSFSATILYAIVIILYKYLFSGFNTPTLTFLIFFIPAILNIFIMPNSRQRIIALLKKDRWWLVLSCFFGGLANLAMNQSLLLGEVSKSLVVIESFLILALVGEYFFLKEKGNLLLKVLAVILATLGAALIRIS